jgi:transcriptional regulator with GAF, ATPase, and Fis domain
MCFNINNNSSPFVRFWPGNPPIRIIGIEMEKIERRIEHIANLNVPIHVNGKTGVGKEMIARAVHDNSNRKNSRFVPLNCGAIPEGLLESEFFGHLKGSFTGAYAYKKGMFEYADGGTIFLDEISELPLSMQVKLLRVIQEKKIRPVGSLEEITVDVRIITASNRNLQEYVTSGKFRQDLLFRILGIEIYVPALHERSPESFKALVMDICSSFINDFQMDEINITVDALNRIIDFEWTGNIRQVQHIIRTAIVNRMDTNDEGIRQYSRSILLTWNDFNGIIAKEIENKTLIPLTKAVVKANADRKDKDEGLLYIKNRLLSALNKCTGFNRKQDIKAISRLRFASIHYISCVLQFIYDKIIRTNMTDYYFRSSDIYKEYEPKFWKSENQWNNARNDALNAGFEELIHNRKEITGSPQIWQATDFGLELARCYHEAGDE